MEPKSSSGHRFEIMQFSNDKIVKIEWLKNGTTLLILRSSGDATVFLADTGTRIQMPIMELSAVLDIEFDVYRQQMFITDFKSVTRLFMAENHRSLMTTPVSFYDLRTQSQIGRIGRNLPPELFPIRLAAASRSLYALASQKGFVFIATKVSVFFAIQLTNMCFMNDFLFVFSPAERGSFRVNAFDENLREMTSFSVPFFPLYLSSYGNRLAVACQTRAIIVEITPKEQSLKFGEYFLKMETMDFPHPICGLEISANNQLLVQQLDNSLVSITSKSEIATHVRYFWALDVPPIIFIQEPKSVFVMWHNHVCSFDVVALFSDGESLYFADPEWRLGDISFSSRRYIAFPVEESSQEPAEASYFYHIFRCLPAFYEIFGDAILVSLHKGRAEALLQICQTLMSDLELTKTMQHVVSYLPKEHSAAIFGAEIKWERILPNMNADWRAIILESMHPQSLRKLGYVEMGNLGQTVSIMCSRGAYIHALIFSKIMKGDFGSSMEEADLSTSYRRLHQDKKAIQEWKGLTQEVAEAALQTNHDNAAFAALLLLGDERYKAIKERNPEISEQLEEMRAKKA
jgi:hypothetical protein